MWFIHNTIYLVIIYILDDYYIKQNLLCMTKMLYTDDHPYEKDGV